MVQQILVYIALGLAIFYLVKKYFFSDKKTGCDTDCGCH